MSIKSLENEFHIFVSQTFAYILPLVKKLVSEFEPVIITLAETTLTGATAGTAWPELIATFIAAAEKQGKTIVASDAALLLSTAEANLAAKGTPAAVTTASATKAV